YVNPPGLPGKLAPSASRLLLLHGDGSSLRITIQIFRWFYFRLARCEDPHRSNLLRVCFDQPNLAGETIDLVRSIHRSIGWCNGVNTADQQRNYEQQRRSTGRPCNFFFHRWIHVDSPLSVVPNGYYSPLRLKRSVSYRWRSISRCCLR